MKTKSLTMLALVVMLLSSCVKQQVLENANSVDTETLTMENLEIENPEIWNSLATQSITIEESSTESAMLKSVSLTEYPSKDKYYYALFEDLYPSQGDYDFNDIVIKSKLYLGKHGTTYYGSLNSQVVNIGGWLPEKVGVMFYRNSGKQYARIPNEDIKIDGVQLKADGEPYTIDIDKTKLQNWSVNFEFECNGSIWISYYLITEESDIMTSGFAPVDVEEFKVPTSDYLSENNLPWGLEIEAEKLAVVKENKNFLKAYPLFEDWAISEGSKNKTWYEYPDLTYASYK